MHPNRLHSGNFESFVQETDPNGGFAKSFPIVFHEWKKSSGVALGTADSDTVNMATIELGTNDMDGLKWTVAADASDIAYYFGVVPMDYDPIADKLRFVCRVRKYDSSTDENTDLALKLDMLWFDSESTGAEKLSAALTSDALAGATNGTDWDNFEEVTFDLDGHGLKPGALFEIRIYPSETVGSGDMVLEVIATRLDYIGSASLNDRSLRSW